MMAPQPVKYVITNVLPVLERLLIVLLVVILIIIELIIKIVTAKLDGLMLMLLLVLNVITNVQFVMALLIIVEPVNTLTLELMTRHVPV